MTMHRFHDELNWSNDQSDEPIWAEFYNRIWPGELLLCTRIDGASRWQQWGIDREIKLTNGKQYTVDEKKRRKDYGDIALEIWSQWYDNKSARNVIGWTGDAEKRCDFIAYAVVPARRCYLLPTELLRLAFRANLRDWIRSPRCRMVDSQNNGYLTRNIGVPWDVLSAAMTREMTRGWTTDLALPAAVADNQFRFPWGKRGIV